MSDEFVELALRLVQLTNMTGEKATVTVTLTHPALGVQTRDVVVAPRTDVDSVTNARMTEAFLRGTFRNSISACVEWWAQEVERNWNNPERMKELTKD